MLDDLRKNYWSLTTRLRKERELFHFRLTHRGWQRRCSPCGWHGSDFMPLESEPDVCCPVCDSRPRQRLLRLALEQRDLPLKGARVLHVSPKGEKHQGAWFRSRSSWYLSIDKGGPWNSIENGDAMQQMDLTDLQLDDGSVDFVCCSHVLECIRDDRQALDEIYRVLAPGGVAALQVQMYDLEHTEEVANPTKQDYWHAWRPGRDYFERYEQAGFRVELIGKQGFDTSLYGLHYNINVPLCWKP